MSKQVTRDFTARDPEEQAAFLKHTWCDHCQAADLGMHSPKEYEQDDTIFVEGTCNQCGQQVFTELTDDEL